MPNGKRTYYGYGWFIGNIQGSPIAEHGGNMGGFMSSHHLSSARRYLRRRLLQLSRCLTRLPEFLAGDLAALAINKPFNIREITLDENLLKTYVGVYEEDGIERLITVENGKLYYQRSGGGNKLTMKPYAKDKFFFENTAIIGEFKRDASGKIISLDLANKRGVSSNVLTRTGKAIPSPAK